MRLGSDDANTDFEIRNNIGDLISSKNSIQECYMEFKFI